MSIMYFDGGAAPSNPGLMHICVILDGETHFSQLGQGTNNIAEWSALCLGMKIAQSKGIKELEVFGDSLLVVNQANKKWKVRADHLNPYRDEYLTLLTSFKKVKLRHVGRGGNLAGKHIDRWLRTSLTRLRGPISARRLRRNQPS